MRYIAQICAMISDLYIIGASGFALYFTWDIFPVNLIILYFVVQIYRDWEATGGFMAWNPKEIKNFFNNAKEMGL